MDESQVELKEPVVNPTRLPAGLTKEQVDSWKQEHGPVYLRMIGTSRVVIRPYYKNELDDLEIREDLIKACTLYIEGQEDLTNWDSVLEGLTTTMKEGIITSIETASGVPEQRYTIVQLSEHFDPADPNPFYKELKRTSPAAYEAVVEILNEYGRCLIFAVKSEKKEMSAVWVFPPIFPDDIKDVKDSDLVDHILSTKLIYPGPIVDTEKILGGHYRELSIAVQYLVGLIPTSDLIEL